LRNAASIVGEYISASPPEFDVVTTLYHTRFNRTGNAGSQVIMTREQTDERNPALGYAPEEDEIFDPTTDDFVSKERSYTHFDLPLSEEERKNFSVTNEEISRHSFWPLLGFTKIERRVRYAPDTGRYVEKKPREIKFGSHADAAILQWYARELAASYESYIEDKPFRDSILAYRSDVGDNVTQARDIIKEIRQRGDVTAIAMDIKGFFDNIDHVVLADALKKVLGVDRLSEHEFKIYTRMTKFESVCTEKLAERLGRKGSVHGRLCSSKEFREVVRRRGESIVEVNPDPHGIPQGTPLSGLYANISMLEFDRILYNYVSKRGGSYRRYSDDLAFVIPSNMDQELLKRHVSRQLKKLGLWVNPNKTEERRFTQNGSTLVSDKPFQYLGFTFDGTRTLIRPSSIHKYYRKMSGGVRAKIRAAHENGVPRDSIYMRELFRKYTHLGRVRNVPQYAFRAARVLDAPEIRKQMRSHMPKFKKTIRYHTDRVYGPILRQEDCLEPSESDQAAA
jgi:RNA-directed DNA polymerase